MAAVGAVASTAATRVPMNWSRAQGKLRSRASPVSPGSSPYSSPWLGSSVNQSPLGERQPSWFYASSRLRTERPGWTLGKCLMRNARCQCCDHRRIRNASLGVRPLVHKGYGSPRRGSIDEVALPKSVSGSGSADQPSLGDDPRSRHPYRTASLRAEAKQSRVAPGSPRSRRSLAMTTVLPSASYRLS